MTHHKILLLVEDDQDTRELFYEVLTDAGYEVTVAGDGQDGLTKAQEGGYSGILLDIMMPKLDGLEVLKALKSTPPKKQNGPIIILSNLTHTPVTQEALKLGAVDYIIKSEITPDQLIDKVRRFIETEATPAAGT